MVNEIIVWNIWNVGLIIFVLINSVLMAMYVVKGNWNKAFWLALFQAILVGIVWGAGVV